MGETQVERSGPILGEELRPILDAISDHPVTRGTTSRTARRWATRGVKRAGARVKLEAVARGRVILTSDAAVARFVRAMNADLVGV